jgi:hypothetical protein
MATKRFRVAFSTALGHEHSWVIDAATAKKAETTVKNRIRVERVHHTTPA